MSINVLIEYCNKCRTHNWEGTWNGLKKYKQLKDRGLIELWSA